MIRSKKNNAIERICIDVPKVFMTMDSDRRARVLKLWAWAEDHSDREGKAVGNLGMLVEDGVFESRIQAKRTFEDLTILLGQMRWIYDTLERDGASVVLQGATWQTTENRTVADNASFTITLLTPVVREGKR